MKKYIGWIAVFCLVLSVSAADRGGQVERCRVIFDTDIGNDVDDVLALGILHALATREQCELLAVTVTKGDELAGPFVDAINTFYGRGTIPIGCIGISKSNQPSKFLPLAGARDNGRARYPHRLRKGSDAPRPTALLRQILSRQEDNSVTLIQVGFFSNFASLLDSRPDRYSKLNGRDLIRQKVKLLSVMAGSFDARREKRFLEYNVVNDVAAAQEVAREWPTPIIWSGFEIGIAVPFPAASIRRDFNYIPHHPLAEAYCLYNPPPHERPTWDLTSVLCAVLPDHGYFDVSPAGKVVVEADGFTRFEPEPRGRDRYLVLEPKQIPRLKEAMVQLASQPPRSRIKKSFGQH